MSFWPPLAMSLLVTTLAAPLVRQLLITKGLLDIPNHRSSHAIATPRSGGIACVLGAIVGGIATESISARVIWALVGAVSLGIVGLIDDFRSLPARVRLVVQVGVGAVFGVVFGPWIAVLGIVLFPVVVNAVNFMDGINGLTAMTTLIWGGALTFLGYRQTAPDLIALGVIAIGVSAGFLPWNAPVAKLFLGDVGSYFLGGLIAAGVLLAVKAGVGLAALSPLFIYLTDVTFTLLRRRHRKERLTNPHREHVYQRLTQAGWSHIRATGVVSLLTVLGVVGWTALDPIGASVLSVVLSLAYVSLPRLVTSRLPRYSGASR